MERAEYECKAAIRTVRTADGRTFQTTATNVTEYLFDPVMVRFLALSIVIYGLLDNRPDLHIETPPEFFALRFVGVMAILGWACISIAAQNWMLLRGWIREIYTPLVSVPMFLFSDFVSQAFSYLIAPESWTGFHLNIVFIITEIIVLLCFDLLHAQFVAPQHPTVIAAGRVLAGRLAEAGEGRQGDGVVVAFDGGAPGVNPARNPAQGPAQGSAPGSAANRGSTRSIRIANRVFRMAEIDWIKSEDQYLYVNVGNTRHLLRASLSDVAAELGFAHGVQANRSVWVSYDAITEVVPHGGGRLKVTLEEGETVIVPRARRQIFEHHLATYGDAPRDD